MSNFLNPDSAMAKQTEGQFQKFLAIALHKLKREHGIDGVKITADDIAEFADAGLVMLTHGHVDSIELRLVTLAEANRLAAYDAGMRGSA